ncbi:GAF domain-containing protein [Mycena chlorophos]|uniref:GAF domain-containing protein n=1 Tax=Mycena chlorophos TaxID=658473 RepID=A0A8H6SV78_MYCCL|nr:GAF domain-containing protein [Mycena chlorophos]
MPHADSALVPDSIASKTEFWEHVHSQIQALLEPEQRNWVTNLSNAASLVYNSLLAFPSHFGEGERAVNWCGFYLDAPLFPQRRISPESTTQSKPTTSRLLLGPFNGRPACQYINTTPGKARGVCADAFLQRRTVLVEDVEKYPGHIACDGATRSEIVCPLVLDDGNIVGVLDLDCLAVGAFNAEDKAGLEKIAELLVKSCDW